MNSIWKMNRFVVLIVCLFGLGVLGVALEAATPPAVSWSKTETRAHPTGRATFREKAPDKEVINIVVALKLRNSDQLDQILVSQKTSTDPQYRHWLTEGQLSADYLPTIAQAQAVAKHLARSGFKNIEIASNRLLISASGTVATVRAAFNTELGHFVRDGKDAIANLTDVHVPNDLAGTVLSVLGLQTLDVAHARTVQALHPVDFPIAYNAVALPPASNTAVGIITVGDMTQVLADLRQFQIENGLAIIDPTIGRNSQYRCSLMKL